MNPQYAASSLCILAFIAAQTFQELAYRYWIPVSHSSQDEVLTYLLPVDRARAVLIMSSIILLIIPFVVIAIRYFSAAPLASVLGLIFGTLFIVFELSHRSVDFFVIGAKWAHEFASAPSGPACKKQPQKPQDLLDHRLLAFSFWKPVNVWSFVHVNGKKKESLTFHPHLSMNDYTGLAVAGTGIGDLPPLVQPELVSQGKLIEVMPKWHFSIFHLWVVHMGNHYMTRPVRVFKEFATQMAPKLFPKLPT